MIQYSVYFKRFSYSCFFLVLILILVQFLFGSFKLHGEDIWGKIQVKNEINELENFTLNILQIIYI